MDINVTGIDGWVSKLSTPLEPAIGIGLMAIAAEAQDRISPYPAAPTPANEHAWYERGFGTKRRRKRDGRVVGRKTSETLGKRWTIASRGRMVAVLRNSASYSGVVHRAEDQARRHAVTGWKTDKEVIEELQADGTMTRIARKAIAAALKVDL